MRRTPQPLLHVLAVSALGAALVACSSSDPGDDDSGTTGADTATTEDTTGYPTEDSSSSPTDDAAMGDVELGVADSSLGEIVVDGAGLTAYYFSNDVADSGVSACEGECLVNWPPITSATETPVVEGVTAEVGTITSPDGSFQVTVDGRPIYLFVGDAAPGDVNGQGVQDVWWVIAPDGSEIDD